MTPQERAKQQAEVMLAFASGASIEHSFNSGAAWHGCKYPEWAWDTVDYRVKQTPKVMKYYCYTDDIQLHWVLRGVTIGANWKPIPSEDKEVLMP